MTERENKEFVLLFVFLLLIASILPQFAELSFVQPSGGFKMIGLSLGMLLSISIYYKWKFAQVFFYVVFVPVLIFDVFLIMDAESMFKWNFVFLTFCHAAIVYVFYASKNMRVYMGGHRQEAIGQEAEG